MRPIFGGGPEDVYLVTDAEGDLQGGGGYPALFYTGESADSPQITDLRSMGGTPITFMITSDGNDGHAKGQITQFQGSDEVWEMWCSVNGSPRFLLTGKPGPAVKELRQQMQSVLANGGAGVGLLGLTDVDSAALSSAPEGAAFVKGPEGVWTAGALPTTYVMTGPQAVPLPFGAVPNGERRRWSALASGGDRTVTFDAAFRTSSVVPTRVITVPDTQVLIVDAEYSSLLGSWVLTRATLTTGTATGGAGGAGGLSAGSDANLTTAQTFTRTATEPVGATITAREWKVIAGPLGVGLVVSTTADVTWKPGSSTNGSNDPRQPTFHEIAVQMTNSAEKASLTPLYGAISNLNNDQGYTGGIADFTTASGDMLRLVQQYAVEKPSGNTLTTFITGLQQCADIGPGPGAGPAAVANLGTAFTNAWTAAANTDQIFRKVQRDFRRQLYWDDPLAQAIADGAGPLGAAIYYDIAYDHGPGSGTEQFGGILAYVRQRNTRPISGGSVSAWLSAICDRRETILTAAGRASEMTTGRVFFHRVLINGGTIGGVAQGANLNLVAPIKWSYNGTVYNLAARPDPVADSLVGTYVLRYTATGAGFDDVTVNVG